MLPIRLKFWWLAFETPAARSQLLADMVILEIPGRDHIFVKKNNRLDLIFRKIISPARFMLGDAVAPFIDHLKIELTYCARFCLCPRFLGPYTCLACYCPGDSLLNSAAAPHPDVLRFVENSGQKARSSEIPVCRNLLQHLEHSVEITPHYDSAEDAGGGRVLLQHAFHICGLR